MLTKFLQTTTQPVRGRKGKSVFLWIVSGCIGLLAFGIAWGVTAVAQTSGAWLALEGSVYDRGMTRFATARQGAQAGIGPVAVVEVKESTYKDLVEIPSFVPGVKGTLNYQEHSRAFHARLVENLKEYGAKAVVFDMIFSSEKPDLDPYFAAAIAKHGNVILAASEERTVEAGGSAGQTSLSPPAPTLRDAAAGYGVVNIPLDADKTVRKFWWWFRGMDEDTAEDADFPALALSAAAAGEGKNARELLKEEVQPRKTLLGRRIVSEKDGNTEISGFRYYGQSGSPSGTGSVVNYENVLRRGQEKEIQDRLRQQLQGKIVFVGDASILGQDNQRTPVISELPPPVGRTQQMPGVEIHAHITQSLLRGEYSQRASGWVIFPIALLCCLLVAFAGRALSPIPAGLVALALLGAMTMGSVQWLASSGTFMQPLTASLGIVTALVLETGFMYVAENKQKNAVKRQLGRHVGKGVADKLADDEWPEMSGESREITMLFSDLQGFTSLSETMTPPEICSLLNRYFGVVFPIVFKYGGMLDKLMGDGMMAYFGFPQRHPDHAARAIKCAIEIQEALEEWQRQPEFAGSPPLRTRIGLHTGVATIGEIGDGDRAEFTVIGDVVNVASRLEGMNKEYGTAILVSDATRDSAINTEGGEFAPMQYRGVATVRGRKEPMPVYSVEAATGVSRTRTGSRTGSASFNVTRSQTGKQ